MINPISLNIKQLHSNNTKSHHLLGHSNFEDRMLKMMSDMTDRMLSELTGKVDKINGMVDEMTQTINSHLKSIVKIETYDKEPSPIYWLPQQHQAEPPPQKNFYVAKSIAKIKVHLEQSINHPNKEEEELQS